MIEIAIMIHAGNKTVCDLPKFGGNLQGKRDMRVHHILAKFMNHNCNFYHAQAKEMDEKYAADICTVLSPGMDYIWRHGASDIQVQYPVGSKHKR